jgi:hypothetical protein
MLGWSLSRTRISGTRPRRRRRRCCGWWPGARGSPCKTLSCATIAPVAAPSGPSSPAASVSAPSVRHPTDTHAHTYTHKGLAGESTATSRGRQRRRRTRGLPGCPRMLVMVFCFLRARRRCGRRRSVDVGCPQLSMHSIRETGGSQDVTAAVDLYKVCTPVAAFGCACASLSFSRSLSLCVCVRIGMLKAAVCAGLLHALCRAGRPRGRGLGSSGRLGRLYMHPRPPAGMRRRCSLAFFPT